MFWQNSDAALETALIELIVEGDGGWARIFADEAVQWQRREVALGARRPPAETNRAPGG